MADLEKNTYYELTVNCMINNVDTTMYFDYVEENKIDLSTEVTNHPLVTGDIIADHQYINPMTESFSGTFSLYGNKKGYSVLSGDDTVFESYGNDANNRLSYIEDLFERIQKEGLHCNIVKISTNKDDSRFKARRNMILTNITWTEKQFSVDFDFTFTEALTADIPIGDDYYPDESDEDLPLLTEPSQRSAVNELLDRNETVLQIVFTLQNEELIDTQLLNLFDYAKYGLGTALVATGVATAVGLSALSVIAGVCGGLSAAVPVGTIIAAAIAVTAATAAAITLIVKKCKQNAKYNIKAFKYYRDLSKKAAEEERFVKFLDEMMNNLVVLENNIQLLGFDYDVQQQCLVNIDNNLYAFTFTKSTENSIYSLSVTMLDKDGNTVEKAKVSNIYEKSVSSLYGCNNDTILFRDNETNTQVYLIDLLAAKQVQEIAEQGSTSLTPEENIKQIRDLRNYGILICTVDMNKFNDLISDVIKDNIFRS